MKKIASVIGGIMFIFGIILMAGSAGDCDGKCMENANTIGEMLVIALTGGLFSALGGFILYKGGINED